MENEWQPAILLSAEQMTCQYHKPFVEMLRPSLKGARLKLVGKKLKIRKATLAQTRKGKHTSR